MPFPRAASTAGTQRLYSGQLTLTMSTREWYPSQCRGPNSETVSNCFGSREDARWNPQPCRARLILENLLPAPPGPLRGLCRSHVGLARRRVHVCPRQRLMHRARAAQNKRMVRDHVVRIFLSKSIRYDLVCIVLDIINENT